jgi:ABC-2 type transport system ATP-binding protein
MNAIVEAENLSRFYGIVLGLNNVSFSIKPGITGVVGPNGAGKTTLFRLLTGQIKPDAGTLRVFGEAPWRNTGVARRMAYCPENEAVPANIRPMEWLTALDMISGRDSAGAKQQARGALDRVRLPARHWKKPMTSLSKGMKQRVKLAQCLLHDPELVILDEPMNGLDPMGREEFANVLRQLAKDGASVVISSHILHDLEALCGNFLLLRWGRMPQAGNAAATSDQRRKWPESTTFRCASPEKLARYFFERRLVRGCDILEESHILHVRWRDSRAFYENFHQLLLESDVPIEEVRNTASFLEKAIDPALQGARVS